MLKITETIVPNIDKRQHMDVFFVIVDKESNETLTAYATAEYGASLTEASIDMQLDFDDWYYTIHQKVNIDPNVYGDEYPKHYYPSESSHITTALYFAIQEAHSVIKKGYKIKKEKDIVKQHELKIKRLEEDLQRRGTSIAELLLKCEGINKYK